MAQDPVSLLKSLLEDVEGLGYDKPLYLTELPFREPTTVDRIRKRADMLAKRIFGTESDYRSRLEKIQFLPMVYDSTPETYQRSWRSGVEDLKNLVSTMIEEVELFGSDDDAWSIYNADGESRIQSNGSGVFVVHGHDEAVKNGVARFIEMLGLKAVILHEQASTGRTIIEMFEDESEGIAFGVVLLTGDDRGGRTDKDFSPRARQNVVFEMGYLIGRLGRHRVASLVETGVELPSDYDGVLYISLSDESWKLRLAKEMKSSGLKVDMNDVL